MLRSAFEFVSCRKMQTFIFVFMHRCTDIILFVALQETSRKAKNNKLYSANGEEDRIMKEMKTSGWPGRRLKREECVIIAVIRSVIEQYGK